MMHEQESFTENEWELIEELLERERSELPHEIHHTRSNSVRAELKERLEAVRNLLLRIRTPVQTSA